MITDTAPEDDKPCPYVYRSYGIAGTQRIIGCVAWFYSCGQPDAFYLNSAEQNRSLYNSLAEYGEESGKVGPWYEKAMHMQADIDWLYVL